MKRNKAMKRDEIVQRQNFVIYVLMFVTAAAALIMAIWYHSRM